MAKLTVKTIRLYDDPIDEPKKLKGGHRLVEHREQIHNPNAPNPAIPWLWKHTYECQVCGWSPTEADIKKWIPNYRLDRTTVEMQVKGNLPLSQAQMTTLTNVHKSMAVVHEKYAKIQRHEAALSEEATLNADLDGVDWGDLIKLKASVPVP